MPVKMDSDEAQVPVPPATLRLNVQSESVTDGTDNQDDMIARQFSNDTAAFYSPLHRDCEFHATPVQTVRSSGAPSFSSSDVESGSSGVNSSIAKASPLSFDDNDENKDPSKPSGECASDLDGARVEEGKKDRLDEVSGGQGQLDFEFVGGGLGKCLLEMDSLTTAYQKR